MKARRSFAVASVLIFSALFSPPTWAEKNEGDLVFIVAADMRNFAHANKGVTHFSGACEAIKAAGKGTFMISPGDLDVYPPSAVRELIDSTLGEDYPWYAVLGNHDPESPSTMNYLRKYSMTVPNVVNRGPEGSEETTYSFDWGDAHFVVLNLYFDGTRDWGLKGEIVPELFEWLKADLAATDKGRIFVFGHEPIVAMPDMDNGRIRHQGDSLDENEENAFALHQLLLEYDVDAYFCGHTHNTSFAKINGLWQLDPGHARGIEEASYADQMFEAIDKAIIKGRENGIGEGSAIRQLYRDDAYHIDRWMKYLGMEEQPVTQTLAQFYTEYASDPEARDRYFEKQIHYRGQTRSSFFRITVGDDEVSVEIYRDDARGGPYELRHTFALN